MSKDEKLLIAGLVKQLFVELKGLGVTFENIARIVTENDRSPELINAKSTWAQIATRVIAQNPEMVSIDLVAQRLLFKTIQQALHYSDAEEELETTVFNDLDELFTYSIFREMNLPIVHLVVDDDQQVNFGRVTFFKIEEKDQKTDWWERIKAQVGGFSSWVEAYGQVTTPGDLTLSIENSR